MKAVIENKPIIIVDASVILKWFLDEQDSDIALRLRADLLNKQVKISIPDFAVAECMNILSIKRLETALLRLSFLENLHLHKYELSLNITREALKIKRKFPKVSFYDAAYHALAKVEGGIFITADESYYKTTKSLRNVCLLKDY